VADGVVLSPDYLAQVRARCEAATAGPWSAGVFYIAATVNDGANPTWAPPPTIPVGECAYCREGNPVRVRKGLRGETLHVHALDGVGDWHGIYSTTTGDAITGNYDHEEGGVCSTEADAAFIAHAREDVPTLLAAAEQIPLLIAEVRALRATLDALCEAALGYVSGEVGVSALEAAIADGDAALGDDPRGR